jgi:rhodanese-related sulfurtransferase
VSRFGSVDELLSDARSRLHRVTPLEAADEVAGGALIVDIRPSWQRIEDGEVPGSVIIERNHLEWRLHPESDARIPQAGPGQRWLVICSEGYTSSLAADALNSIGVPATDIVGGIHAWKAAGLPWVAGASAVEALVHA